MRRRLIRSVPLAGRRTRRGCSLRLTTTQPASPRGATTTGNPNEISLSVARTVKSDVRVGDFMLRNVGDNLFFRGLWVRRPAGYTAIVRHTDPQNNKRVIQTPNSATTTAACLVASNQAGLVRTVFGAPKLIDFGVIEIFPNNPQIPPPPVDDVCP